MKMKRIDPIHNSKATNSGALPLKENYIHKIGILAVKEEISTALLYL